MKWRVKRYIVETYIVEALDKDEAIRLAEELPPDLNIDCTTSDFKSPTAVRVKEQKS